MADKSEREKPRTPESLQKLLTVDKVLTKTFCDMMDKFLPYTKYRKHYKFLEYSCHALPWFFACLGALWLLWNEDLFQTQVNLLFGILIAESVQWLGKSALPNPPSRKARCFPSKLYPSGGAIISTFVACFFCYLKPLYAHMRHLFVGWAALVCVSRILSCKHSILDVICGIFLGYLSAWILYHLWLGQDVCRFILTLEGGRMSSKF
uniref:Putative lipid phosphate phosphatase PPAPDC3 n=1 Tax=Lygus hesperus TaxID=30085 RepID=A0A0A9X8L4_LYGHE